MPSQAVTPTQESLLTNFIISRCLLFHHKANKVPTIKIQIDMETPRLSLPTTLSLWPPQASSGAGPNGRGLTSGNESSRLEGRSRVKELGETSTLRGAGTANSRNEESDASHALSRLTSGTTGTGMTMLPTRPNFPLSRPKLQN